MPFDSKPPDGTIHSYTASSPPRHRRIAKSASCSNLPVPFSISNNSTRSSTEAPRTTAKVESFSQFLKPFNIEILLSGKKEIHDGICAGTCNDITGVHSKIGEVKDTSNIEGDLALQKTDPFHPKTYIRTVEPSSPYNESHNLDDKHDAKSKSSNDEEAKQTVESSAEPKAMIEKGDIIRGSEDSEATTEVVFSETEVPWNPTHNVPMVVLDTDGIPQALSVLFDTGAACSLIPDQVVRMLKLKKHPIQASDRRHPQRKIELDSYCSFLGGAPITPTHFVILKIKGHRIGLDDYVKTHVRVLDDNTQIPRMLPTDIIFGIPFIVRNNIFQRLSAMPQAGNPFYALLKGKQSDTQKMEDLKLKEEDRTLAEHLNRIKSAYTTSRRATASTVTRDSLNTSMGSWDHSGDWQCQDSCNTSLTMASSSSKDEVGRMSSQ